MPAKLFFVLLAWASAGAGAATANNKEQLPDLELLEFLGSFETADGEWVDPMEIDNILENENRMAASSTPKQTKNKPQTKDSNND